MSGTTWSVALAKRAILDLLNAASWPGAIPQLSWGAPRSLERECVILGGVDNSDQEWAGIGDRRRNEDYRIWLWVGVDKAGDSQEDATVRAVELFAVVETVLRANSNLGGSLPAGQWAEMKSPSLVEFPTDGGYAAIVQSEIRVKARI